MRGGKAQRSAHKSRVNATTRETRPLAVEVMAELVAEGAEERADRGEQQAEGIVAPASDIYTLGLTLALPFFGY